jgi:arylsulfatase A-like enzyme/Flp pilus assembly protein TadD
LTRARALVALLLLAAGGANRSSAGAVAPQRGSGAQRPNILLITLDTVRADRMGFLGSTRGLTAALDAFARQATVFTQAFSQAPITTVSHATILTGMYPPAHGVRDFGDSLGSEAPYLPDLLHRVGYRTGAFVGSLVLDPRTGTAQGFERGFDVYDAGFRLRQTGDNRYRSVERRGDEVVARAVAWITGAAGRAAEAGGAGKAGRSGRTGGAWFAWVHLFDAHDPYDPPAAIKSRYGAAPYDGEIAWVDQLVSRLLSAADPGALVIIAADHGEALGDHGEDTHGVFLYDATLHVPLVVRWPARRGAGVRVTSRVRLTDIAPTILDAAGVTSPSALQGEKLPISAAAAGLTGGRAAYAESDYPHRAFGWSALAAWRSEQWLFVRAPQRELYDVANDPGATKNLASAQSRVADGLDAQLAQFVAKSGGGADGSHTLSDSERAKRLASLGYVSGGASTSGSGADPKSRISVANALRAAIGAVEDGAFDRAIPLLQKVTREEPTIAIAQLNLGVALARTRQHAAAIAPLRAAVALDDVPLGHYELGSALYETGDVKSAAAQFAIVAARMPKWADARYSLGSVYARIDRIADATSELRAALALEPRHFRANLLLGRILTLQGQAPGALKYLQTAVAVQPQNGEAHSFLADAYDKSGDAASAAKERQRAQELRK